MLDLAAYPLRARPVPPLPVERLVLGRPVEEAAELLPRLFNLCRVAQGTAARAAFGLPLAEGWQEALRAEILREHVVKLCLKWPGLMSRPAVALPPVWQTDMGALSEAVFGEGRAVPRDIESFEDWLAQGQGAAPVLGAIGALFAPGEGARPVLPLTDESSVFSSVPQENSVPARHARHPLLAGIEARWGRGPLWSATGVLLDLAALLDGRMPPATLASGRAVVPAARGLYGVRATVERGVVTRFERVTPTDHLLAPEGGLAHSLASLPPERARALAPLLVAVLDPCYPVSLRGAQDEDRTDA
ncbi:hydrogenase expression/formation protein HupK [Litorisediminicola beolgyonensis]|uniref:Hydrogenase expression/formation protein HupK n=1 Tax=Litorisediminicola beolgyonensis TaxID=1173614 RepID=A0ABW3ZLB7_9RHOB